MKGSSQDRPQQRFVCKKAQLPGNRALTDVRIETVETAGLAGHDPPAGGRVGIGVGQMGEVGRQRRLPIHCDPVHGLRHTCPRQPEREGRSQRNAFDTIRVHSRTILSASTPVGREAIRAPRAFQTFRLDKRQPIAYKGVTAR